MCWEPELETLDRGELEALQADRLRATVARAAGSPYYRDVFAAHGVSVESIATPADIRRLPVTTKQDLRDHYPFGILAVPSHQCIRLHCSSGTTGNPTVIVHTRHDLDSWANLVARSMFAAGVRPDDVFQNICGYGLFTGGLGFQYGAERLGTLSIPAGAGNTRRQIKLMKDYGTTVVHAIPSYLPRLHQAMLENDIDPVRDRPLRRILTGAEPHTEGTRQRIQQLFGVKAFNSYGLSEMNGPGVAFECEHQTGLHLWEDAFLLEILDPQTLAPVPDGEEGEVVLTTLDREAMPLIRYRTRDLARIIPGDCPCGRTHRRLSRILGRSDDMFIFKGCNVFPMQVEQVLMQFPEVGHDYAIELVTGRDGDEMLINVELHPDCFSDEWKALDTLRSGIERAVRDEILVRPHVKLLEPDSLPKAEGKAIRFRDRRQSTAKESC